MLLNLPPSSLNKFDRYTVAGRVLCPRRPIYRSQTCCALQQQRHPVCTAHSNEKTDENVDHAGRKQPACFKAIVAVAAAFMYAHPALAELQTVTASEAVSSARPIAAQTVHKGRVWLLLGGGAALLFGSTVVVENNEQFFPAISKANKAMRRSRESREEEAARLVTISAERERDERMMNAVELGLSSARLRDSREQPGSEEQSSGAVVEQTSSDIQSSSNQAIDQP